MEPFIAQIMMFGGNFAPRGWALCDGQLLPISSHSALFSILGTTYGGDGRTTFGLPDLRGRFPMHPGNGPGLPSRRLGERGGQTDVILNNTNLPAHNHSVALHGARVAADSKNPNNNALGLTAGSDTYVINDNIAQLAPMASQSISEQNVGNNLGFSVENPYLTVNFIIALEGIFPSRS